MRTTLRLTILLTLLSGTVLVPRNASAGTTFTVNSAAYDPGDAAAGDGVCDDGNGVCTLKGAIEEANAYSGNDAISFSIAPAGVHTINALSDFPSITEPLTIDGSTQPGGGDRGIVVTGPNTFDLFHITAGQSVIRGLVANGGTSTTLVLIEGSGGNTIEGNYLGTDANGTTVVGASNGVKIKESPSNIVQGNLITTHGFADVEIFGATASGNQVLGNRIGTDASGTVGLEGTISVEASNNVVADNLICPGGFGVQISDNPTFPATGNVLQGNLIGTDATGTTLLDCNSGVSVGGADTFGNVIGGSGPGDGNVLAGSGTHGLRIAGGGDNVIQGNHIGTDITGTVEMGALFNGIEVSGSTGNLIGGTASGAGNLISGNGFNDQGDPVGAGLSFTNEASFNEVRGNLIGIDAQGGPLGNGLGVLFDFDAHDNTIGGTDPGAGNTIAFNELQGVWVPDGSFDKHPESNAILGNSIHDNGFGIDLRSAGVTPNDPLDADLGGNNGQNRPSLTSAGPAGGGTYVTGSLDSSTGDTFRIEIFSNQSCNQLGSGEGEDFLGATTVTTDGSGQASFALTVPGSAPVGAAATATATNTGTGDTSEFSECQEVVDEADLEMTKAATPAEVPPGGTISYTVTVSNPSGPAESTDVLITDPIPADATLVAGTLDDDPECSFNAVLNRVECAVGTIMPTASRSIDFEVQVSDDALVPSIVTNTASVTSSTSDPDLSNNVAGAMTDVDCDLIGTPLDDVLMGGTGIVSICGLGGNDHLLGKEGSDILVGGPGNDKLNGNLGDDVLIGGSGSDLLFGQAGSDALRGGNDNDTLKGGPDDDELNGGAGTDACDQQGGGGSVTACEP